MENVKKYLKENKIVLAIIILFIIIIVVAVVFKNILFSGTSNALYGNRLDGINKVKVTNSEKKDVINNLKGDSAVKNVSCSTQGKIINIILTVNDDIGSDTAKTLADKVLPSFSDDQLTFY